MKIDFKIEEVNDFFKSLSYSTFVSKEFILSFSGMCQTLNRFKYELDHSTTESIEFNTRRLKEHYAECVKDVSRLSIFSDSFKQEMLDVLTALFHGKSIF